MLLEIKCVLNNEKIIIGINRILIGAPKAASEFQPGVNQPGAVYQCELSGASRCKQIPFDTKGKN